MLNGRKVFDVKSLHQPVQPPSEVLLLSLGLLCAIKKFYCPLKTPVYCLRQSHVLLVEAGVEGRKPIDLFPLGIDIINGILYRTTKHASNVALIIARVA